jgi:hypothetical protein
MPPPFQGPQPASPPRRSLGTSGTHFVSPPSPSLDPAAIQNIEPKDRVRHEAAAALALGRSCGDVACKTVREIHVDQTLDLPTRHRRAHDQSFKLIAPAIAPLEAARAKNAKAIEELKKIIAGPAIELCKLFRGGAATRRSSSAAFSQAGQAGVRQAPRRAARGRLKSERGCLLTAADYGDGENGQGSCASPDRISEIANSHHGSSGTGKTGTGICRGSCLAEGEALAGYPEGSRGGEMTTAMPTRIA